MTHVDLDSQPELIRQFVLGLSAPEGADLESAGRPMACLLPPPKASATTPNGAWTDAMNQRRCELLDRKYDHGLSPGEEAEQALLQDAMYRHVDRAAPQPLDDARSLHQELLSRASPA